MAVQPGTWDLRGCVETVRMAHAFFTGIDMVSRMRIKDSRTRFASVTAPIPELPVACNAIPLNLARLEAFTYKNSHELLKRITGITTLLGWGAVDGLLKIAYFSRAGTNILDFLVDNLFSAWEERVSTGLALPGDAGASTACFEAHRLLGLAGRHGDVVTAGLHVPSTPCLADIAVSAAMETLVAGNVVLDVPESSTGTRMVHDMEARLVSATMIMERTTRTRFNEDALAAAVQTVNEIKTLTKEFLHGLCARDVIPMNPRTFTRLQRLLDMALVDMNSNPRAFKVNLAGMLAEMERRVAGGTGYDARDVPALLCTPWDHDMEPATFEVASACGARVIVAGWDLLGHLEPVPSRNPLTALAKHLVEARALTRSTRDLVDRIVQTARDLGVAGIITHRSCLGRHEPGWVSHLEEKARPHGLPVLEVPARGDQVGITTLHDDMNAFVHEIHIA